MSKEAYYFSHDCNARNDDKIIAVRMRHGMEGYGIYFAILERLRESKNYMSVCDYNIIAYDLRVEAQKVKSIVEDFGLFHKTEDRKHFYSDSFNNRMSKKDEKSRKLSEAGKKGNQTRWGKSQATPKPSPPDSQAIPTPSQEKETKEKESKEREGKKIKLSTGEEKMLSHSLYHLLQTILKNGEYLERLCMNNRITLEKVSDYTKLFFAELENRGDTHKTEKDAKDHFAKWLIIQLEKKKTNTHAESNQPSDYTGITILR